MTERGIPKTYHEQPEVTFVLAEIQGPRFEEVRTAQLHDEILHILQIDKIVVIGSSFRTKDRMSIKKKISRPTRPIIPLGDIYGIKLILDEEDIPSAVETIRKYWPTPENILGISTTRTGPNQIGPQEYYSERVNIVFDDNKLAELQLVTPDQEEENKRVRKFYEEKRGY